MRTPIYALIAALLLGGCTHYHVQPAGTPTPSADRVSQPEPAEPLELEVGRPHGSQLLIQTNRPAYVAIFEIIPNRGVTLIYPAAAHQQNMLISGLTWVPLWWSPKRVTSSSDRYIYAVASEEPLQLSSETFTSGYFHRVLGAGIYRAERPYTTMREISRAVVPDVAEEEWAEDVYVLTPTYVSEPYRTARIYCPGGRVFDVPEDMVSRVWCPTRTRVVIIDVNLPRSRNYPVGRPARPDSVYGHGGGRVRIEPRRRGPIHRVVDPTTRGRDDRDRDDRRRARDDDRDRRDGDDRNRDRRDRDDRNRDDRRENAGDERDERDRRDEKSEKSEKSDKSEKPEKPDKDRGGRIKDLIDARKQEQEHDKQERERQRREAEEARRREAAEREAERQDRKDERREDRDARKDERETDRDARKQERDERKDDRKDDARQQGHAREEQKREEKRDEPPRRGSIKDMIKEAKEKEKKEKP